MSTSILEALEYMRELIRVGWEFPDAAFRAARAFKINQAALEQAYDDAP